ncbi:hypothetical protein FIU85_13055 [Roseovarius sp. THAF8]|uniref:hypothetical protein n=1 Tax=Roseovarius sp. THAF8 TaxID=2587846 RepID=UPI0012693392|nr:hypothetical protein [Roseovarius sp. THAF8]QFT98239.1 hypothetical protein FIU85_13055 [Roseovarius sp. THAF8]
MKRTLTRPLPRLAALALCATGLRPDVAAAADWVDFSGDISVGANSIQDNAFMSRVDAMLTFTLFDVADSPVAFEFGTFGYYYKGDRPHETYAAFVYDDRFRLGVVKPTYDRVLISPFDFTAASIAETRAEYTRARATTEALRFNSVPVGVSYGDTTGDTSWAVSLLDASDGNFRSAAGSAEWRAQAMTFAAAIEGVWDPKDHFDGINAKIGARWQDGRFDIGAAFLHPDANQRPDAVAFDVNYNLWRDLTLSGFGEVTRDSTTSAYGLAARYDFADRSDVSFAVTDTTTDEEVHFTYTRRY